MPAFGVYPIADVKTAGDEVSSTYEGRHVTVLESDLIHPSHTDGFADNGDPVVFGTTGLQAVGVVVGPSATAATDLVTVDTEGIWIIDVNAADDGGNSAVEGGERLYISITTAIVSKIADASTNIPFGYALGHIDAGETNTIAVKVHWDPIDNWVLDDEKFYFGDAKDVSVEWNEANLVWLPVADDTGAFNIGNGTLNMDFRVYGNVVADFMWWDNSVSLFTTNNSVLGANARANRMLATVATPNMDDGYAAFEQQLDVSGLGTGQANAASTWINLGAAATIPGYMFVHTDGVYDAGATLTSAYMSWSKYTCILASDPAQNNLWELNFSGVNSGVDALFAVNDPALCLGWIAGTSDDAPTGSIPFFQGAGGGGGMKYIRTYDGPIT